MTWNINNDRILLGQFSMKRLKPQIAFLFEHPAWSKKLIETFEDKGINLTLINVADLSFSPDQDRPGFDLAVNRINIMPSAGRNSSVASHTLHYLTWLETLGIRVINGSRAHFAGASKAVQNGLFSELDLHCAKAVAVHKVSDIPGAAKRIGFPLIIKPNIGGSGSGISRYDSPQALDAALETGSIDLGIDGTGMVQAYIGSDGYVYRVEILGDRLFYSIRQKIVKDTFNYCAADGCAVTREPKKNKEGFDYCALNQEARIQPFRPSPQIVEQVISIVRKAGADLGGVEYLKDTKTGQACFYDFNPYSNFVSNGNELFGFSPEQRFVEFIMERYYGGRTDPSRFMEI